MKQNPTNASFKPTVTVPPSNSTESYLDSVGLEKDISGRAICCSRSITQESLAAFLKAKPIVADKGMQVVNIGKMAEETMVAEFSVTDSETPMGPHPWRAPNHRNRGFPGAATASSAPSEISVKSKATSAAKRSRTSLEETEND